jgi:hypothetical protein
MKQTSKQRGHEETIEKTSAVGLWLTPATSALVLGLTPAHICTRTGLTPAHIYTRTLAHPCHIYTRTLAHPCAHLHPDWAHPCPHLHPDFGSPLPTSAPGLGLTPAHICAGTERRTLQVPAVSWGAWLAFAGPLAVCMVRMTCAAARSDTAHAHGTRRLACLLVCCCFVFLFVCQSSPLPTSAPGLGLTPAHICAGTERRTQQVPAVSWGAWLAFASPLAGCMVRMTCAAARSDTAHAHGTRRLACLLVCCSFVCLFVCPSVSRVCRALHLRFGRFSRAPFVRSCSLLFVVARRCARGCSSAGCTARRISRRSWRRTSTSASSNGARRPHRRRTRPAPPVSRPAVTRADGV